MTTKRTNINQGGEKDEGQQAELNRPYRGIGSGHRGNQEKTGRFMAEMRRQQNLTQRQLAEQVGVSDKTAQKYLDNLVELGMLTSEKIGRERIYRNDRLFKIIKDTDRD